MARPKRTDPQVNLTETAGSDQAGVARAVYSWALLLADQASQILLTWAQDPSMQQEAHQSLATQAQDPSPQKDPPTSR